MEFFSEYGLFLLKTLTFVIALLLCVLGIAALSRKPKHKIEIISLNQQYEDTKNRFAQTIKNIKPKKKKKIKNEDKTSLYVIDFHGDIKASQTEELREAITAILTVADANDEVLIRLEGPGGTVNGYGLAASQLERIRNKNIPLTVCIDKMAASGVYLMACVANKIIAAPFAIVGSIGVVAQLPNFHRWLKKNNIDVELLTAGEYKRTLTLFAENTEKGRKKFQEELEKIHDTFRNYVLNNRPQLNMEKVATGEHWLAKDAYELKLVDQLKTSDDYLTEKMKDYNAFRVAVHSKRSLMEKILKPVINASPLEKDIEYLAR